MAIKDPFVSFFKKRKETALENIQKVREFKQKFIAEPLQKIPELVTKDLFQARKKVKKTGEQYMKTARKIRDFETKHFTQPLVSGARRVTQTPAKEFFLPTATPVKQFTQPIVKPVTEKVREVKSKVTDYTRKFGEEARKASEVTDELIKSQYKGAYSMLTRYAADTYQGDSLAGKLMSVPSMTYLLP